MVMGFAILIDFWNGISVVQLIEQREFHTEEWGWHFGDRYKLQQEKSRAKNLGEKYVYTEAVGCWLEPAAMGGQQQKDSAWSIMWGEDHTEWPTTHLRWRLKSWTLGVKRRHSKTWSKGMILNLESRFRHVRLRSMGKVHVLLKKGLCGSEVMQHL